MVSEDKVFCTYTGYNGDQIIYLVKTEKEAKELAKREELYYAPSAFAKSFYVGSMSQLVECRVVARLSLGCN